ncbi:MAG: hypothetical protein A3K10_00110 [Bacteroidetes bacterium RIFCSPLOWO2_12_FULL_31_6]|nr:MAG: hypothetical protein A3K10_00110 [Bacteroidetes bacterium RIFCSPLOWO2_12_FULL_31_6]
MKQLIFILLIFILLSCSKENKTLPSIPYIPEQWERFSGNYKVYDTLGNYRYEMNMIHYFSGDNIYGNDVDTMILQNFADTFDLKYEFRETVDDNVFSIGIFDSIVDKNNKSWLLAGLGYNPNATTKENYLFNDTLILYFEMDNIKYYINEAQPYFFCKCKQVAVKQ